MEAAEPSSDLRKAEPLGASEPFSFLPRIPSLRELVDLDELQALQDALAEASGLSLTLTGPEGYAVTRPSNLSPLCQQIRKTDKGRRHCLKSERAMVQQAKSLSEPALLPCQNAGIQLVCIPVRIRERHLGSWILGHLRPSEMEEQAFMRYCQSIHGDPEQMLSIFLSLPVKSREKLMDMAECVHRLSRSHLAGALEKLRLSQTVSGLERSAWELRRYQEYLEKRLEDSTTELNRQKRVIEELTVTDALTGCYNRNYLSRQLSNEVSRAKRYGHPLSLCMIRLDNLDRLNERFGETGGNTALQELAGLLKKEIRGGIDWLARYEGNRFVLVFPETDLTSASRVVDRLRRSIRRSRCAIGEARESLSANFGLCAADPSSSSGNLLADRLLMCARAHLERAAASGSSRIVTGWLP